MAGESQMKRDQAIGAAKVCVRRSFIARGALGFAGVAAACAQSVTPSRQARVAITLDLEMSRNFPTWEHTRWDYEKGNLDDATKHYAVEVARRVKARGGVVHFFLVGAALEQEDVAWLKQLLADGHRVGNHTYDHVNVKATKLEQIQFRFQRAPWLIAGRNAATVIRDNIRLCNEALTTRLGSVPVGFRTPGGFGNGLADAPHVQQMLAELGFKWCSSKYPGHVSPKPGVEPDAAMVAALVAAQAQAQPFRYPSGLVEIPMSPISDIGAFRTGRWQLDWFLRVTRAALEHCLDRGLVFDFLAHPSCLGVVDPECRTIEMICDLVAKRREAAALTDLDAVARSVG